MNIGEKDELLFKILLTSIRDSNGVLFGEPVYSVGFLDTEYDSLPEDFDISSIRYMSEIELSRLALSLGIYKAPTGAKADVYINREGVSLKSLRAAPAALVNHTARPGFEFACYHSNTSIELLDTIISDYWDKRIGGRITEDTKISDGPICPFYSYKEELKPVLEYFLFTGTGSRLSVAPADYLIEFLDPFNMSTYKKLTQSDAVDSVWPNLIFSVRAKKGMPSNYNPSTYVGANAESIEKWVEYHSGDYRGALHIRASR